MAQNAPASSAGAQAADAPATSDGTSVTVANSGGGTGTTLFIQSNQLLHERRDEMVPGYRLFDPMRDGVPFASGAPAAAAISPTALRHVYGFDQVSATGAGQTIAIVDAPGDPNAAQALNNFCNAFNLPPASFTVVYASGQKPASFDSGWGMETDLDIEWAHAIAPGANILLVVANSASEGDLLTAVDYANSHANVVSMSWGGSEWSTESGDDSHFAAAGVSYFASSGDNGAGVEWPAVSANVTGVGGTTLLVNPDGSRYSETAWSGSGGGTSRYIAEPNWQSSAQSSGKRQVPDISYDADPNTGVIVIDSNGGQTQVGGTSMGAPQWAAFAALLNSARSGAAGALNPNLYPLGSPSGDFFDITAGSDGHPATVGYDSVTGLGAPQGPALFSALGGNGGSPSPSPSPSTTPSPSPSPSSTPSPSPSPSSTPSPSPSPAPAPRAPSSLRATAISGTTINLRWLDNGTYSSINVQWSTDRVNYTSLGNVPGSATTSTVSGARRRTTYYFRLQAANSSGQTSPYSNVASVRTP